MRDICIDAGLIRRGDPELPERPPASSSAAVPLLRHLLRLSCGTTAAARRTDADRRFAELVARLHQSLVVDVDVSAIRAAERCRDGMCCYIQVRSLSAVGRNQLRRP